MKVTVNMLNEHIRKLNNGLLDFSQVELNTRADLVRFEGFSLEEACTIDLWKAHAIVEGENEEDQEEFSNDYGLTCKECNEPVSMEYTDSPSDGYSLCCKNEHYDFVSVYAFEWE